MLSGTADVIWCYSPFIWHVGLITVVFWSRMNKISIFLMNVGTWQKIKRYLPDYWSGKGLQYIVANWAYSSLNKVFLEITTTLRLKFYLKLRHYVSNFTWSYNDITSQILLEITTTLRLKLPVSSSGKNGLQYKIQVWCVHISLIKKYMNFI